MPTETVSHTAGPWVAEENIVYASHYRSQTPLEPSDDGITRVHDNGLLALVYSPREPDDYRVRFNENARLIAAAPDLLAALKTIMDGVEGIWPAAKEAAYAAIEKAEGR